MKALLTSAMALGVIATFGATEAAQAADSYQGQVYQNQVYQGRVIPAGYYRHHRGYYYGGPGYYADPYYYGDPYYYYNEPLLRVGPVELF